MKREMREVEGRWERGDGRGEMGRECGKKGEG